MKKSKKIKKNSFVKVGLFLLAAWLVVSAVFSVFAYYIEFNKTVDYERMCEQQLLKMLNRQDEDYIQQFMIDFYSNWESDYSLAGALFDTEGINLTVSDSYIEEDFFESEENLLISFYGRSGSEYDFKINGYINSDNFLNSMTSNQYREIIDYLIAPPNENSKSYKLVCTEFYYGVEGIRPKTVEIALLDENDSWYKKDNVVKTYELNPKLTGNVNDNNRYYHWDDNASSDEVSFERNGYVYIFSMDVDHINIFPADFILYNFRDISQEKPVSSTISNFEDEIEEELGTYKVEHVAPFTYVYKSLNVVSVVNGSNFEYVFGHDLFVRYEKQFNVLHAAIDTIGIGVAIIFVFSLLICVITVVMLNKVLRTQEEAAQKRRDLTNSLAHDIKTPLFIISGYAQSLKENLNTDKKDYYADRIIQRTKEVNLMVHQILSLAKLDTPYYTLEREDTDLTQVLDDILADYPNLPDNRSFRIEKKANCIIYADKYSINRAIRNIIENAIKYSDIQTVIGIEYDERAVSISNVASGISQESVNRFTEAYYRGDKSIGTEGSGLGLSAVKNIVDMHGYKLDVSLENNILTVKIIFRQREK